MCSTRKRINNDKTKFENSEQVFWNDNYYLDSAQMMIAVIGGPEKDRIIFGVYLRYKTTGNSK